MSAPELVLESHRGSYRVRFGPAFEGLEAPAPNEHFLVDARVAELYPGPLCAVLARPSTLRVEATEEAKSLERLPAVVTRLLENGIRRNHVLVAVGGGIVQDIAAFTAATLLRGLPWRFHPTTLLAQADSCIGSKSSINVGRWKNQLGTFTPPDEVRLSVEVLKTLSDAELRSGLGEILKVHILSGEEDFRALAAAFPVLPGDRKLLEGFIRRSLEIKKALVEADEFDRGPRLILNYGHSFGHALESATGYALPHGIAVTLGMAMANRLSERLGFLAAPLRRELAVPLEANAAAFRGVKIPEERFFEALLRDKKNTDAELRLVLLRGPGRLFLHGIKADAEFRAFCRTCLAGAP